MTAEAEISASKMEFKNIYEKHALVRGSSYPPISLLTPFPYRWTDRLKLIVLSSLC